MKKKKRYLKNMTSLSNDYRKRNKNCYSFNFKSR